MVAIEHRDRLASLTSIMSTTAAPGVDTAIPEALGAMAAAYDRCFYPQGAAFQLAAIAKVGDRTERLGLVQAPRPLTERH